MFCVDAELHHNQRLDQSSAVVTVLAFASVAPTGRCAPFVLAGEEGVGLAR